MSEFPVATIPSYNCASKFQVVKTGSVNRKHYTVAAFSSQQDRLLGNQVSLRIVALEDVVCTFTFLRFTFTFHLRSGFFLYGNRSKNVHAILTAFPV